MPNFISEDQIERALKQKLQHLHGIAIRKIKHGYRQLVNQEFR